MAAYERASTIYDQHAEAWQRTLDQDHLQVYNHAAARLEKTYKDPQHYIINQCKLREAREAPVGTTQERVPMPHVPHKGAPSLDCSDH